MNLTGEAKALIGIGLATLIILVGGIFLVSNSSPTAIDTTTQKADPKVLVKADSYKKEIKNAKVTVVEFLDFECEACRAAHPTVKLLHEEYKDKVTFVVRYFPLPGHKKSRLAATVADAAGKQGKFWEMHDMLFDNQGEWGNEASNVSDETTKEIFLKYAQELNLDTEKITQAYEDKSIADKIQRDINDGNAVGVNGTPTFFINSSFAGNVMSYEEFKSKIDAELNK